MQRKAVWISSERQEEPGADTFWPVSGKERKMDLFDRMLELSGQGFYCAQILMILALESEEKRIRIWSGPWGD